MLYPGKLYALHVVTLILLFLGFDSISVFFSQANIKNVHNMNWSKFVADQLHDELSSGKFNTACLFMMPVHFFLVCELQVVLVFIVHVYMASFSYIFFVALIRGLDGFKWYGPGSS